ncbi:MAG: hypothetical protein EBU08_08850 [Micrococcales bacterium]|nr:hypothetical protein [Micrococcales bacterium]
MDKTTYKYQTSMIFLVGRDQYERLMEGDREQISELLYRAADLSVTDPGFSMANIQAYADLHKNMEELKKISKAKIIADVKNWLWGAMFGAGIMAVISKLYYAAG